MEDDRPGKVFVGGLSFELDEEEFEKAFSKFGKITEVLLKRDQQTNKSRGFGFITFENPADAEAAVDAMDQTEVKGKMIHVDQAVKPGGRDGDRGGRGGFRGRGSSRGFIDRGRGGFRGSRGGGFRGSTRGSFRGSFRGDRGRGDRGGRGGRGSFRDRDDDRRGPPRRSSFDRSFGDRDRGPPRRDDDRDRFGSSSLDRGDRYRSDPSDSRRGPDPYRPSPPRGVDRNGTILSPKTSRNATKDGNFRDYGGGLGSRDYSPPPRDSFRDRGISRDYGSSRDVGISSLSRTYDTGRDSFSSRDPYRRDDYVAPVRDSRDYAISRDPPSRDYLSPRDSARPITRDFDRGLPPPRDSYDSYRDRSSGIPSRGYGGSPPRRSPPPPRSYSPLGMDRGRDLDRDRGRGGDYSPGSRRPAPYDSRGPPPPKRSRPDDGPPLRGPPRDGPPRGMSRDGPLRDSPRGPPRDGLSSRGPPRGPPRDGPRDSGRGGPPPFRR